MLTVFLQMHSNELLQRVENVGPYVNVFIEKKFVLQNAVRQVCKWKDKFGGTNEGQGKTVVVEYR